MKNWSPIQLLTTIFILLIAGIPLACDGDSEPVDPPNPVADPTNANTTISTTSPVDADGTSTAAINVVIADTEGNRFTSSAGVVSLSATGSATLSSVTDNGNGTYAATASNTTAENVTISGMLNNVAISDTATITFEALPPQPDPSKSIIEATSPIIADGTETATITITLIDTEDNAFTSSNGTVTLSSTGTTIISDVTDKNDGTYTATATNTTAETVTISGSLDGVAITDTAEIEFTAPVDPVLIAINAGGEEVIIDAMTFKKDTLFDLPSDVFSNTEITDILETEADTLYITERYPNMPLGTIGYSIPADNGTYEVKLHFAELFWGLENQGGVAGGVGSRIFDIFIEDTLVLDDYDIFADVGAATATIKTFETTVSDGVLNITMTASVDQPKISAIEVIIK